MPTRPGPVTEDYSEDLSEDRISPAAGIRHGYRRTSQHQSQRSDAQTPERISVGGRLTACCQLGSTEEERDARQSQSKLPSHITVAPPSFSAPLLGRLPPAAPPVKAQPLGSLL
ncbi:unnamed protein product [Gadus morhua 'NCC']